MKILSKYFDIISLIIGIIIGICINLITNFLNLNYYLSISILILNIILYIILYIFKNKLISLEYNLANGKRKREFIYDKETRICEDNNMYQIKIGNDHRKFVEPWTKAFPDKEGSGEFTIELLINGVIIKTFKWIYCDGGKYYVPRPKIEIIKDSEDSKRNFYWEKNSLEFKIAKVIGHLEYIKEVSSRSNIKII